MTTLERILELAEKNNMTANKLLVECKLPSNSISYWKQGIKRPGLDALLKIADCFNVSLDYLVGRETPPVTSQENRQNTACNVTTAPLLNFWQQLDEIQQSKVLVYMQGMLGITDQSIPTPMDIAINEGRTIGHKRGREEVEKQKQKKMI